MDIEWHNEPMNDLWTIGSTWPSGWTYFALFVGGLLIVPCLIVMLSQTKAGRLHLISGALAVALCASIAGTVSWHLHHPHPLTSASKTFFTSKQQALDHRDDFGTWRSSYSRTGTSSGIGLDTTGLVAMRVPADHLPVGGRIVPANLDWSDPALKRPVDEAVLSRFGLTDIDTTLRYAQHPTSHVDASNGTKYRTISGTQAYCLPVLSSMTRDAFGRPTHAKLTAMSCEPGVMTK